MAKTVYVGMSGGVDSSVTAALLVQQGYRVVGVFMKNWTADVLGFACPWRQDLTDAQSVAAKLGIPLKIFDFQTKYKQKVVDYMINEYRSGFTPNPDVMCNQEIKFKLFLDTALAEGADLIATGHYARITQVQRSKSKVQSRLLAGVDKTKDQSYFLYRVNKEALKKALMPLGGLKKTEVRQLAQKFELSTATKPDSTGICFVGEVPIREFLGQYIKPKPGPIKTLAGKVIGEHEGAVFYTIGQRHGLNVGGGRPYYVVGKDIKLNTVVVTDNPADAKLHLDRFKIADPHWINDPPVEGAIYQIRTRYRGRLVDGKLKAAAGAWMVKLTEPERAITPGQSAVVYDGELVLGGGIISLS
ncbi:tRNA 2-thiouridine(34) synthase MnmA [Candidatus Microgenomates bacterium]|nr:tRNA 2-thiouridine(34) synthase MnmA [Candidatus Microgenomates bacterium]